MRDVGKKKRPAASGVFTSWRYSRSHTDTRTQHRKAPRGKRLPTVAARRDQQRQGPSRLGREWVAKGQSADRSIDRRPPPPFESWRETEDWLGLWPRHSDNAAALAPPSSSRYHRTVSFWLMLSLYGEYSCSPFFPPVAPSLLVLVFGFADCHAFGAGFLPWLPIRDFQRITRARVFPC